MIDDDSSELTGVPAQSYVGVLATLREHQNS